MNPMLEKAARALKAEADTFVMPVERYVEGEAAHRYETAYPDRDAYDINTPEEWDVESWVILVRAVLTAVRPTDTTQFTQTEWRAINDWIDAILES